MNILRAILAVVLGVAVGGAVNMALILVSPHVIPPPAGVDVSDVESIRTGLHLFEPKHFLFPFLAHAIGTLVGATLASLLAAGGRKGCALVVGVVFLAGGIAAVRMIPAPGWFAVVDLCLAYLPMAWIGATLGSRIRMPDSATG